MFVEMETLLLLCLLSLFLSGIAEAQMPGKSFLVVKRLTVSYVVIVL